MTKMFSHAMAFNSMTTGIITIDNNTGTPSQYPYSWWITQEAAYTYPSGSNYVMYTEGGVSGQSYYLKDGSQFPLPLDPWPAADIYIAKQALYDIAYADFLDTPINLSEAKEQKAAQLLAKMVEIRKGRIIFGANTFETGFSPYSRLQEELAYSVYLTDVPLGYYVTDIADVQVSFTLINLQDLVGGIQKLYYECYLNHDIHYAAIQALGTIAAVQAYDITTGWPTVPFTP